MNKLFNLHPSLKPLFWDVDISKLDLQKHKKYIIERVLENADIEGLKWLFSTYDRDSIIEVLRNSDKISEKSGNFFYLILGLDEPRENFKCLQKPYTQRQNRF